MCLAGDRLRALRVSPGACLCPRVWVTLALHMRYVISPFVNASESFHVRIMAIDPLKSQGSNFERQLELLNQYIVVCIIIHWRKRFNQSLQYQGLAMAPPAALCP